MAEKTDLQRAVEGSLLEIGRMAKKGACPGCDPGDEGSIIWDEIGQSLRDGLKNDVANAEAEGAAFVACYRAVLALAKGLLADANRANVANGTPDEWPAGQEWNDLVSTSHSIFLRQAREQAGIDDKWFAKMVQRHGDLIEPIYEASHW